MKHELWSPTKFKCCRFMSSKISRTTFNALKIYGSEWSAWIEIFSCKTWIVLSSFHCIKLKFSIQFFWFKSRRKFFELFRNLIEFSGIENKFYFVSKHGKLNAISLILIFPPEKLQMWVFVSFCFVDKIFGKMFLTCFSWKYVWLTDSQLLVLYFIDHFEPRQLIFS